MWDQTKVTMSMTRKPTNMLRFLFTFSSMWRGRRVTKGACRRFSSYEGWIIQAVKALTTHYSLQTRKQYTAYSTFRKVENSCVGEDRTLDRRDKLLALCVFVVVVVDIRR